MKIKKLHNAMVIPRLGTIIATMSPAKGLRSSWPNTRSATPSQVAGKAKMIQDAAHAAYHRDKVLSDPFIKEMQDLIDGLKRPS